MAAPKMPQNPMLRLGIYVVLACALLWLGAVVLAKLIQIFIWVGVAGLVMIAIGIFMEWNKAKKSVATATAPVYGAVPSKSSSYLDEISAAERKAAEDQI